MQFNKVLFVAHQLWPAALLLCKYLEDNQVEYFGEPFTTRVVELGAGVGLGGIVAGMYSCHKVLITDLPEAMDLIRQNISLNRMVFPNPMCIRPTVLRWGDAEDHAACVAELNSPLPDSPDHSLLVIAADCVYWEHLFEPLMQTFLFFTAELGATIVLSHIKRWKREKKFFAMCAKKMSVELVLEKTEMVSDDDIHSSHSHSHGHSHSSSHEDQMRVGGQAEEKEGKGGDLKQRLRRQVSRVYVIKALNKGDASSKVCRGYESSGRGGKES